jgi:hypothetical protein
LHIEVVKIVCKKITMDLKIKDGMAVPEGYQNRNDSIPDKAILMKRLLKKYLMAFIV